MDFIGFYLDLLGFTTCNWVYRFSTGFYLISLAETGFSWVLPGFTGFWWVVWTRLADILVSMAKCRNFRSGNKSESRCPPSTKKGKPLARFFLLRGFWFFFATSIFTGFSNLLHSLRWWFSLKFIAIFHTLPQCTWLDRDRQIFWLSFTNTTKCNWYPSSFT